MLQMETVPQGAALTAILTAVVDICECLLTAFHYLYQSTSFSSAQQRNRFQGDKGNDGV